MSFLLLASSSAYEVFARYDSQGNKVCSVQRYQDWRATAETTGLSKLVLVEVVKDAHGNIRSERIVSFGSNPGTC